MSVVMSLTSGEEHYLLADEEKEDLLSGHASSDGTTDGMLANLDFLSIVMESLLWNCLQGNEESLS